MRIGALFHGRQGISSSTSSKRSDMPAPENHTLRLLQEIRGSLQSVDQKVDGLSDKVDRNHEDLKSRIDDLARVFAGATPPPM